MISATKTITVWKSYVHEACVYESDTKKCYFLDCGVRVQLLIDDCKKDLGTLNFPLNCSSTCKINLYLLKPICLEVNGSKKI